VAQLVFAQAILMSVNSLMVTSAAIIDGHLAGTRPRALRTVPLMVEQAFTTVA
jgi:hypothetical protein